MSKEEKGTVGNCAANRFELQNPARLPRHNTRRVVVLVPGRDLASVLWQREPDQFEACLLEVFDTVAIMLGVWNHNVDNYSVPVTFSQLRR